MKDSKTLIIALAVLILIFSFGCSKKKKEAQDIPTKVSMQNSAMPEISTQNSVLIPNISTPTSTLKPDILMPVKTPSLNVINNDYLKILKYDMEGKSEAIPFNNEDVGGWTANPRIYRGLTLPGLDTTTEITLNAWGVIQAAAGGSQASNVRIEIINLRVYILDKNDKWLRLDYRNDFVTGGTGNYYSARWRDDNKTEPKLPDTTKVNSRREADGNSSIKLYNDHYAYHFWTSGKKIDLKSIKAIVSTYKARLVVDDKNKPDDRKKAKIVACSSGDYYVKTSNNRDKCLNDFAIGRFKYVTSEWKMFSASYPYKSTLKPVSETPVLPKSKVFSSSTRITIPVAEGTKVIYTLDDSNPAIGNGIEISKSTEIKIDSTKVVKAIAIEEDWGISDIAKETYTISK